MVDFDTLTAVIDNLKDKISFNSKLIISLGILVCVDIIMMIIRICADFKLKKMEINIIASQLREQKRIDVCETLFKMLDDLSDIDRKEQDLLIKGVGEVTKLLNDNYLYIPKEIEGNVTNWNDYFIRVASNYKEKSNDKEIGFKKEFKKIFNK